MRVGIFDSGVGGINVLKELIKKYPHNEYIFYDFSRKYNKWWGVRDSNP